MLVFVKSIIRSVLAIPCRLFLSIRGRLERRRLSKNPKPEMVTVSMTSWKKRISNVPLVLDSILNNTKLPDRIVLNLSIEEFPNKEMDLPESLLRYKYSCGLEIIWNSGNTRAFKKIIPTMNKYPDDVIIAIDDDFIYPEDFIETFIDQHLLKPFSLLSGNDVVVFGEKAHCGCASLVKRAYFGKFLDELMDEKVVEIGMDDIYYTMCAVLNGFHYEYVGKDFFLNMPQNNPIDGLSSTSVVNNDDMRVYLAEQIRKKYHIHMSVLSKPFFVL